MSGISESIRLNIVLPIAEWLNGTCASYWFKKISEMSTWPKEKVISWQEERLRGFVKHAYEHTVYYRRLFDSLGLTYKDIQCAEDLKKLPIITKKEIRAHFDELVPDNIESIPHRFCKTGGTTGEPMAYLTDENVWGFITASKIYSWKKSGYRYGDKFAALGSASLFQKKASLKRRIYDWIRQEKAMNSMNMSDSLCCSYLERMRKEHIHYIYGYASSVFLLARYARDHQIDVSFVKGVFTTSENLTDIYRAVIESTFHCRVMDSYGAKDAGITAFEIIRGKYPISYDVIAEVVEDLGTGEGTLVSTCFLNEAFPLIRYDFGDQACIDFEDTLFNTPVLTKILGRTSDVIKLENGNVLTSPGYTILMNSFDVSAYRIIQVSGHEVKMQIQPCKDKWDKDQEINLTKEMQRFVGEGCVFTLECVDEFKTLDNGKAGFFYNN